MTQPTAPEPQHQPNLSRRSLKVRQQAQRIFQPLKYVRESPYAFIISIAVLTGIAAIGSSAVTGVPLRDPEGFMGPAYIRLPLLAALIFGVALIPAGIRRCGWQSAPRGMVEVVRYEWTVKRLLHICTGLLAFYVCYVGYRNLKSVLPIFTDELIWDTELAQLDQWLFGGVNPAFIFQDLFGVGLSAGLLSFVYLAYLPLVPISVGLVLVVSRDLSVGAWYATALSLNWVVGVLSYYVLPAVGPIYYQPQYYDALPETGTSSLQDSLWNNRIAFLADPLAADVIHGVAAFASLHCSVTFTMALFAHKTIRNTLLRWAAWAFFGLTFLATLYFGWHYLVDSIAGVFIGWLCVVIGQWATRNRRARRPAGHDRSSAASLSPPDQRLDRRA